MQNKKYKKLEAFSCSLSPLFILDRIGRITSICCLVSLQMRETKSNYFRKRNFFFPQYAGLYLSIFIIEMLKKNNLIYPVNPV